MPAGSAPRSPRSTVEPGDVIPGTRYRALRRLTRGSGGAVYEVEHLELGRRFALKLLPADLALRGDLVRRARADWQALGKLRHPNIARVTDAGMTQHGLPYFVTEQLSGETLRQRLARRRSVSVPEALAIARDVSHALAAAHAIGVVHCDVRPETVFLTADGRTKLLDFGVANLGDARAHGESGAIPERNRNATPEQGHGQALDGRSDLYGVGLVLFEMVAGRAVSRPPVVDRSRRATAQRSLAEVLPGVARPLSDLVAGLLAPDADARPRCADDVVRELSRLEQRYEHQVSTTQATAHYVTARLPFLVDTASMASELGVIVPMPSQTLEGIPWTVADQVEAPKHDSGVAMAPSVEIAVCPPPLPAVVALERLALAPIEAPLPLGRSASRMGMGLVLVMSCSLLGGVLVASLARRGIAFETNAPQAKSRVSKPPTRPVTAVAPLRAVCPVAPPKAASPPAVD